jgi:hypothetical protein
LPASAGERLNSFGPLALEHLWPLREQARRFELGHILNSAVIDAITPSRVGELGIHHAGLWECDLADQSLVWSGGVYDIFGLERGAAVTRPQALACYSDDSRVRLEHLRSHAILHRCGFTIDVEIRAAAVGELRCCRLIGAAVCDDAGRATRIRGLQLTL